MMRQEWGRIVNVTTSLGTDSDPLATLPTEPPTVTRARRSDRVGRLVAKTLAGAARVLAHGRNPEDTAIEKRGDTATFFKADLASLAEDVLAATVHDTNGRLDIPGQQHRNRHSRRRP